MKSVNVHEAKTHLSRLLERVEKGEKLVIARSGEPVAMLVPIEGEPRRPGRLAGRIRIAGDFDSPLPEDVARAFRGEAD